MTNSKKRAEISTAYAICRDLISGRCNSRQAEYLLSEFANDDEIARIMAAVKRDAVNATTRSTYTPLTETEVATAYLGN